MKRKIVGALACALAAGCMLAGCGSSYSKYDSGDSASAYVDYEEMEVAEATNAAEGTSLSDDTSYDGDATQTSSNRKLIRNVEMEVETKTFDDLVDTLYAQVSAYGGYVEDSYTWNGSNYSSYSSNRYANLTIRIPKENLDDFLGSFTGLCNVTNKTESVKDITLTYVDLESHKKALEVEEERLLELLAQAEDIYTMLSIEERLTDVRYNIDSMESQLRTYDDKVDYSTVTLNVSEVKEITVVEPEPETAWERITRGFMKNLKAVGNGLAEFGIWFVTALPYLILWGGIIFGIVMIIRAIVRHNIKKNRKAREEAMKNHSPYGPAVNPMEVPFGAGVPAGAPFVPYTEPVCSPVAAPVETTVEAPKNE